MTTDSNPKRRGRPPGKHTARPGTLLFLKQRRNALVKDHVELCRNAGLNNGQITRHLQSIDPDISRDMVHRFAHELLAEGRITPRKLGAEEGMRPETRARHVRVCNYRLQGEEIGDIAKAEGISHVTAKMILSRNRVRKGSIADFKPFDPATLNE